MCRNEEDSQTCRNKELIKKNGATKHSSLWEDLSKERNIGGGGTTTNIEAVRRSSPEVMWRELPRSGERERERAAGWISGGERALRQRRDSENEDVLFSFEI